MCTSACVPLEIAIIVGMGRRTSSRVWSLMAALVERKRAQGNNFVEHLLQLPAPTVEFGQHSGRNLRHVGQELELPARLRVPGSR